MFKTTLAAAAIATAAAVALPATTANAGSPHFYFGFNTPHGQFGFGNGYPHPAPVPHAYSCWQAKNQLQGHFAHVWTVECHGQTYTFKVKNWGPVKVVKFNKYSGNFWYA